MTSDEVNRLTKEFSEKLPGILKDIVDYESKLGEERLNTAMKMQEKLQGKSMEEVNKIMAGLAAQDGTAAIVGAINMLGKDGNVLQVKQV